MPPPNIEEYIFANGEYLIGRRPDCDIRLADPSVSRVHARLVFDTSGLLVADLGSTNGTFLNDRRIVTSRRLQEGTLSIGKCRLLVAAFLPEHYDSVESPQLRVTVFPPDACPDGEHAHRSTKESVGCADPTEDLADASQASEKGFRAPPLFSLFSRKSQEPEEAGSRTDPIRNLAIGDRVEFQFGRRRGTKRILRLKSISGPGDVYFFHPHQASDYTLSVPAERLSSYFRDRSARIVTC